MRPPNHLAIAEIFRPQHVASRFRGGVNDRRAPETQFRFLLQRNRANDIVPAWREDLPYAELAHTVGRFLNRKRLGDLPGHRDKELLRDLDAETAGAGLPRVRNGLFGCGPLPAG